MGGSGEACTADPRRFHDHKVAYERVRAAQSMPGVIEVSETVSIGQAIEDILLLAECSLDNEWEGQVHYLPLR